MKNLISKLISFKQININEFKTDKLKYILKMFVLFFSFVCLVTLPSFTYREQYNNLTNIFSILLAVVTFIYVLFKGKIVINSYILCLLLFLIYGAVLTLCTTNTWTTMRSILTLYLLCCVLFTCIINFKNPNFYIISFLIGLIVLAIWMAIDSKEYIFNFSFENRIGDEFGNLNSVGVMLSIGSTISCYYIFKNKKYYFFLLIFPIVFGFLLIITGSKTAIVTYILGFLLSLYFLFGKKKILWYFLTLFILLVLFIIVIFLPPFQSIKDRFVSMLSTLFGGSSYDLSTAQRYTMFADGLYLWQKSLIFGHGSESFSILSSYGTYSHSNISELLCNFGLLGFCIYYFPFVNCFFKKNKSSYWSLILPFVFTYVLFSSIFNITYLSKHITIFASILMAILYLENENKDKALVLDIKILKKYFNISLLNFNFNKYLRVSKPLIDNISRKDK